MISTEHTHRAQHFLPALNYSAPFLIEKLLLEHIVETPAEGEALFVEAKKFMVLERAFPERHFQMYSNRIDEAWHQFILFTLPYTEFCFRFFGKYVHHAPSNSPIEATPREENPKAAESTFDDFKTFYEMTFAMPLPDIWFDERSVTPSRRATNKHAGKLEMRIEGSMARLFDGDGRPLFSVSKAAGAALAFIARTGTFFVRELPGELTDEEKVGLVTILMSYHILSI